MVLTLVMDGVRRQGLVPRAMAQPMPKLAPVVRPVMPVVRSMAGRPSLDGVRRAVPTPRELLETMVQADAPEPEILSDVMTMPAPAVLAMPEILPQDGRRLRNVAAFGLVATALVTASVAAGGNMASHRAASIPAVKSAATTVQAAVAAPAAAAPAPKVAPAAAPIDSGLQNLLNGFVAGQPDIYGIVVKNLSTGETATVNGSRVYESASMYKLFVADEIYHEVDLGQVTLGQGAGGGSGNTIGGCLKLMITISDNTCGRALGTIIGWGNKNAALNADGYVNTSLTGVYPQTSAADIAKMFERVYTDTLNSPTSNAAFLNLLKGQLVNNRLPQGVPAGTVMAHKTGDLDGYMHDGGIIYGPKGDYVVVMMGAPGSRPSGFANLSQQVWNHFEQ